MGSPALTQISPLRHVEDRLVGADGRWAHVCIEETAGPRLTLSVEVRNAAAPGDAWHHARRLEAELDLGVPAACRVNGQRCGPGLAWGEWDLEVWPRSGLLKDVFWWVCGELWDVSIVERDTTLEIHFGERGWQKHPEHKRTHRRMEEVCRWMAERAAALSDPDARSAALRVPADARFFTYAGLVADRTGRVRQMIDVCSNLLTLAAVGARSRTGESEVIQGICDGRPLPELIAIALPPAVRWYTERQTPAPLSTDAGALTRWAPASSIEDLLGLLHAPGVDVHDIPRCERERAMWRCTVERWTRLWRQLEDRGLAERLGGFVSRHGCALDGEIVVDELLDWVTRARPVVPCRRSSPRNVRRAIDAWHERLALTIEHDPSTPLATGPLPRHEVARIEATPIATVGELVAEGIAMHHCVASLVEHALEGSLFLYRATIGEARVTIAVGGARGRWYLQEASGFENRPLEADERAVVERWVEALA